jgi:Replication initiator protein A
MEGERRRPITSERATLDPFEALAGQVRPRDQRDLMERPFFSLAKAKRVTPILYQTGDTQVQVYAVPEHGMATIWDADVLIWAASLILTAQDRSLPTSRFFRFTPCQLLIAVGRATGSREYQLLKGALTRLQSTVIRTIIGQALASPAVLLGQRMGGAHHAFATNAKRRASNSGISMPRARACRGSPTSCSISAVSSRVSRCQTMRLRLNTMTIAASSWSCGQAFPQGLWKKLWASPSDIGTSGARITVKSLHRQQIADA